jgi:hypothetical protein
MRLNSFLWNTFVESARGREWIEFFSGLRTHYAQRDEKLIQFIDRWASQGIIRDRSRADHEIDGVQDAITQIIDATKGGLLPSAIGTFSEAESYFRELGSLVSGDEDDEVEEEEEEDLFFVEDIPRLSVALFCLHPKMFFPYYFYPNFHALKKICDEFGIFLPPVPAKNDYDARFYYYLELARSLYEFWAGLGLPPEHIPAFLYGFAPEVVDLKYPVSAP